MSTDVSETNQELLTNETEPNPTGGFPMRPVEPETQSRGAEIFDLLFRPTSG